MELVTGHGASEHITAAQVSRLIQGVTVMDDTTVYRLNVGNDCAIGVNGLTVGISTGEMVLHGYHVTFEDVETLTLDPTLDAAKSRIDKICLIISEDLTTGIQSAHIQVVQGTEATSPSAPATPSTPTSPTELYMGVGVIATVTVSNTVIASYVDNTDLYAGSFVTKTEFDTNIANIAPIEATSTASKAYAVGNHLIYNGILYKVDAAIAQGATLTPGGNISLSPDVEAQIASLKSSLNNLLLLETVVEFNATFDSEHLASDSIDVSKNGYKPIAIAGFYLGAKEIYAQRLRLSQNSLQYTLVSSWHTGVVTQSVEILYMKTN